MKNAKLNKEFLEQYKFVFTEQLIQRSYGDKEYLSGKDILQITAIRQLNLFILKILFRKWQDEMKKLESPYFDYKTAEVRKSMVDFMNTLSQHIRVDRNHIKPLVHEALYETCLLSLSPADYIRLEFDGKSSVNLNKKLVVQTLKYMVLHKDIVSRFLKNFEGQPIDKLLEDLNELEPVDKETQAEELASSLSKVLVVNKSDLITYTAPTLAFEIDPGNIEDAYGEKKGDTPGPSQEVTSERVDELDDDQEIEQGPEAEQTIDEVKVDEELENKAQPILNEKFEMEAKTLADLHEEKKIDSIMDGISINHKYMFIQELFEGESQSFDKAVREVEDCTSFDEAVELLVQSYSKDYKWDMNSDEVKELLKVVFRRFR